MWLFLPNNPVPKVHAPCNIVICGLSGLYNIFPHFLRNDTNFGRKFTEYEICVLIFPKHFSETFVILDKIQREAIINLLGICANYALSMSQFNRPKFSQKNLKKYTSNFMEAHPVGAQMLRVAGRMDGQTEETFSHFRKFLNSPKY